MAFLCCFASPPSPTSKTNDTLSFPTVHPKGATSGDKLTHIAAPASKALGHHLDKGSSAGAGATVHSSVTSVGVPGATCETRSQVVKGKEPGGILREVAAINASPASGSHISSTQDSRHQDIADVLLSEVAQSESLAHGAPGGVVLHDSRLATHPSASRSDSGTALVHSDSREAFTGTGPTTHLPRASDPVDTGQDTASRTANGRAHSAESPVSADPNLAISSPSLIAVANALKSSAVAAAAASTAAAAATAAATAATAAAAAEAEYAEAVAEGMSSRSSSMSMPGEDQMYGQNADMDSVELASSHSGDLSISGHHATEEPGYENPMFMTFDAPDGSPRISRASALNPGPLSDVDSRGQRRDRTRTRSSTGADHITQNPSLFTNDMVRSVAKNVSSSSGLTPSSQPQPQNSNNHSPPQNPLPLASHPVKDSPPPTPIAATPPPTPNPHPRHNATSNGTPGTTPIHTSIRPATARTAGKGCIPPTPPPTATGLISSPSSTPRTSNSRPAFITGAASKKARTSVSESLHAPTKTVSPARRPVPRTSSFSATSASSVLPTGSVAALARTSSCSAAPRSWPLTPQQDATANSATDRKTPTPIALKPWGRSERPTPKTTNMSLSMDIPARRPASSSVPRPFSAAAASPTTRQSVEISTPPPCNATPERGTSHNPPTTPLPAANTAPRPSRPAAASPAPPKPPLVQTPGASRSKLPRTQAPATPTPVSTHTLPATLKPTSTPTRATPTPVPANAPAASRVHSKAEKSDSNPGQQHTGAAGTGSSQPGLSSPAPGSESKGAAHQASTKPSLSKLPAVKSPSSPAEGSNRPSADPASPTPGPAPASPAISKPQSAIPASDSPATPACTPSILPPQASVPVPERTTPQPAAAEATSGPLTNSVGQSISHSASSEALSTTTVLPTGEWRLVRLKAAAACEARFGTQEQETHDGGKEVFTCDAVLSAGALAAVISHHSHADGDAGAETCSRQWVFCADPLCLDSKPTGSILPAWPKRMQLETGVKVKRSEVNSLKELGLDIMGPPKTLPAAL